MTNDNHDPFDIDSGLIDELTANLHAKPRVLYREGGVNALDQYKHEKANKKPEITKFTLDKIHRIIEIEDYATGIEDEEDFKRFGTSRPKRVGEKTSADVDSGIVGKKHIGKLTFRAASKTRNVWFYSNNGEVGTILQMDKNGWCKPIHKDTTKVLSHIGLRIIIDDVMDDELLNPRRMSPYISKVFALRIARGAKIYINDILVQPPKNFNSDWGREPFFKLSNDVRIRGNLKHRQKPEYFNIDVFENTIWVKAIHVDYDVEGWLDIEKMDLRTDREDFVWDEEMLYEEFEKQFNAYLPENGYHKTTNEQRERKLSGIRDLQEWTRDILCNAAELFDFDMNEFNEYKKKRPPTTDDFDANTKGEIEEVDKWTRMENVAIIPNELDGGNQVIILGDGEGGGPGGGGGIGIMADITDGGTDTALVKERTTRRKGRFEPITPEFEPWNGGRGPLVKFLNPKVIGYNIDRPAHVIIKLMGKNRKAIVVPPMIRAFLDYKTKGQSVTAEEYFQKYDDLLDKGWM